MQYIWTILFLLSNLLKILSNSLPSQLTVLSVSLSQKIKLKYTNKQRKRRKISKQKQKHIKTTDPDSVKQVILQTSGLSFLVKIHSNILLEKTDHPFLSKHNNYKHLLHCGCLCVHLIF